MYVYASNKEPYNIALGAFLLIQVVAVSKLTFVFCCWLFVVNPNNVVFEVNFPSNGTVVVIDVLDIVLTVAVTVACDNVAALAIVSPTAYELPPEVKLIVITLSARLVGL